MEQNTNPCLDENGLYPLKPNDLVDEVNATECGNLKANSGLDGSKRNNCDDLQSMVCDIKQEVDAIAQSSAMVVATNEDSKCQNDTNPTLASMMTRILRWSQAATCVLCAYDPYVATILKTGKYPQILMGSVQEGGYPQWVNPDELPTEDSKAPVTSGGVYQAVQDALLGVWHPWEEYPTFGYFAETLDGTDDDQSLTKQSTTTPPANGDTALVANDGTHQNALYTYNGTSWVFTKELEASDGLVNFAVTNILKGYYETRDIYYFVDGSDHTWNVMDADLSSLEASIAKLQEIIKTVVTVEEGEEPFVITTAPTLADAEAVNCTEGKTTIVLITGE